MSEKFTTPLRSEIKPSDQWDLGSLFSSDSEWETAYKQLEERIPLVSELQGTLGTSAESLRDALQLFMSISMEEERLGYYAHLKYSEDAGNSENQARFSRFMQLSARIETEAAFQCPEILAIPDETIKNFMKNDILQEYLIYLERLLRFKPHILGEKEEKLLAMQAESNQTANKAFSALTDVDIDYGSIETPEGIKPLTQSSFSSLMQHNSREVRENAYLQFYGHIEAHQNTIAALYGGSVQLDVYQARARGFTSSRESKLFADDVPETVYDTLIDQVHEAFPALHSYYQLRSKVLGIPKLRLFDVKVPLLKDVKMKHSYEDAVQLLEEALAPLGDEYVSVLSKGLRSGWVDRYENKGKRSGAFSAGSFLGDPYILMNYKEDVLRDIFTLAHEGGHSMHSYYSAKNNPFQNYQYTIFEAEVASTFNEQLLFNHMLNKYSDNPQITAYLLNLRIDDILATLFRQTMFAEYEKITHDMVETGKPLTVESLRTEYANLQRQYFGESVAIEAPDDIEGLRIPHFYRAFYVYKYATGISAAISLSDDVLEQKPGALDRYFSFLKSGGSKFPIESLAAAGADMHNPEVVGKAIKVFRNLLSKLEKALDELK